MIPERPLFSVCIPAYNRARHLPALLDSIVTQDFRDFEIVICEDCSPEREAIASVVQDYQKRYPGLLHYLENERNLGYDGNIRNLIARASGRYCFFMGNDDILCPDALSSTAALIARHPNVGVVIKSYAWFDEVPEQINQEVRWYNQEKVFAAGASAIAFAFRRSGVISGYIVDRDAAHAIASNRFDGSLYYQMYLTANVLVEKSAVCTPRVLVLCRNGEPPDFGNSENERGRYVPGHYTPTARLNMVGGALSIIRDLKKTRGVDVVEAVVRDYANYFYPYIRDQFGLPLRDYLGLYREFARMGFARYPLFHLYFLLGFVLGERRFDAMTAVIRKRLGRSPRF